MGQEAQRITPLRVVLDTNCLISALVFSQGRTGQLRALWKERAIVPIICPETASELARVLAYSKFGLTPEKRQCLLGELLACAEWAGSPVAAGEIEEIKDKDDAVFIHLAREARADFLVSGDRHLLGLPFALPGVRIVSPAGFLSHIHGFV